VDGGFKAVVMEVSSHALELRRVAGIAFDVAVFTNISQDHLNFHPDMHHYLRAKGRLFEELGSGGKAATAVVNIDDPTDRAVLPIEAHALDQGDKAPGKAMSYATKYAMLKLLSLETGEADEGRVEAVKPNTAKQVAVDAFEEMPEDEKKFLQETATGIIDVFENDGDLANHVEGLRLETEEKLALWSLLPSKVRTAITKALKADAESKPKRANSERNIAEQA
jgi:hypothetical protein